MITKKPRASPFAPADGAGRGPAPLALAVYGTLTVITLGVAIARGRSPIEVEGWIPITAPIGHVVSVAAGAALAVLTIRATREFVRRWGWARMLHADLRPAVKHARDATIVVLGVASGIGEELFFRGLLTEAFGIIASSLAFGVVHQLGGRVRWIWAGWATVMGVLFGTLFLATGSLLGPILAHTFINVANLRFLRDTDVEPKKPRRLGGLLDGT
jgi:CAAX protease family protein